MNNSLSIEPPYNSTYFELKYIGEFIEFSTQDLKILFSENGFEIKLSSNLKGKVRTNTFGLNAKLLRHLNKYNNK